MYLLLVHSNSIVLATSRQHTPVHHIAMCCINAHAGVRLTHPVLYSVGVYTDTPTTCIPSDQNNWEVGHAHLELNASSFVCFWNTS